MNLIFVLVISILSFGAGYLICFLLMNEKNKNLKAMLTYEKEARSSIEGQFTAAASEVLKKATAIFSENAIKDMRQVKTEALMGVSSEKNDIHQAVEDMRKKISDCQMAISSFEKDRVEMYSKVHESINSLLAAEQAVRIETSSLRRALTSSSGIRGLWGEKILKEILDQNDFVCGIHYDTQVTLSSDAGDFRPDCVIHLPGGRKLAIDAKEVSSEYLASLETDDPQMQKNHLEKLVQNIRLNFQKLSKKEYQIHLDKEIPFVVMFIPSEAVIRAAFSFDPQLFEEANKRKVILASPMTIVPLVYLVAHSWNQYKIADNALELSKVIEELGSRLGVFFSHVESLGEGLSKACESWAKVNASYEKRVIPQLDKAKGLGAKLKEQSDLKEIPFEKHPKLAQLPKDNPDNIYQN